MDMVLDTNTLSDFLSIFYSNDIGLNGNFTSGFTISDKVAHDLNKIVETYRYEGAFENILVILSTFAFIEIAKQF